MRKVNKKYIQIGVIALVIACICIAFDHYLDTITLSPKTKSNFSKTMFPIFDGIALAYFLNPLMKTIEARFVTPLFDKFEKKRKKPIDSRKRAKQIRGISLAITMILFLVIIAGLILLIVPQLLDSVQSIITRFPSYI